MNTILRVENLSKDFKIPSGGLFTGARTLRAVDDVSFTIGRGETFGLVGESGCGKSTLGKVILNLIPPTSGSVHFDGIDVYAKRSRAEERKLRQKMQIIFQDPYASLNPRMKIRDAIAEPLIVHGLAKGPEIDKRIKTLLDYVGLSYYLADRYPKEFSGGQRQRIGIARALAVQPELIICDEAVSALDVSVQSQILNLFADLQDELGLTYLFIAHGLNVVKHISDRVGVMYLGKLVEVAAAKTLYANPLHPYTEALFSAIPIPDPAVQKHRLILKGEVPSPLDPPSGCVFRTRCRYASADCAKKTPVLEERRPGHFVACHHELSLSSTKSPDAVFAAAPEGHPADAAGKGD
jgi:oligopeptide/dipeptide ABC transporter ATP-binding protein